MKPSLRLHVSTLAFALTTVVSVDSFALGRPGHHRIAVQAWDAMRAGIAGNAVLNKVQWNGAQPTTSLEDPGPCATGGGNCGRTVTAAEWLDFRKDLAKGLTRFNSFQNQVIAVDSCSSSAASMTQTLSNLQWAALSDHGDAQKTSDCHLVSSPRPLSGTGIKDAADPVAPQGIYGQFSLGSADGNLNQGYALGWHAKYRDDDNRESVLYTSPIIGTLVEYAGDAFETLLATTFAPFVCGYYLFTGKGNCLDKARALADDANIVETINTVLPHIGELSGEMFIGFWHFVDARSADGRYDDRHGLYYEDAGPEHQPGALDHAIIIAADLAVLTLDANKSLAPGRYQLPAANDGHTNTKEVRSPSDWTRNDIGETEFSPLDNLAFYGWNNFRQSVQAGQLRVEGLGWPLHAIGDATVPQHVANTTSHGHVAYENWVDAHLDDIYFVQRGCRGGDCDNQVLVQQYEQTHRILEHAFRFRDYLQTHGIRDLITQLAVDTLTEAGSTLHSWPYCDVCSVLELTHGVPVWGKLQDALVTFVTTTLQIADPVAYVTLVGSNPVGYYNQYLPQSRALMERGVGAAVAFIVSASANTCNVATDPCTTSTECCVGYICNPTTKVCESPQVD